MQGSDRPFCDLNGEYPASENVPRTCIADPNGGDADGGTNTEPDAGQEPVACSKPGEPLACDADTLVRCTDASIEERVECAMGCSADELRCFDLAPSNDLAAYLDQAAAAEPLVLSGVAEIDTDTGNVFDGNDKPVLVQSAIIDAPSDGVPIRVVIAKQVEIESLTVSGSAALAIVTDGSFMLTGRLSLDGDDRFPGPGAISAGGAACLGKEGDTAEVGGTRQYAGNGGGGHRTDGAPGGSIDGVATGGAGGARFYNPELVPLRGGCGGYGANGTNGGGAVQISSRHSISLPTGSIVNANGGGGAERGGQTGFLDPAGGGGAGGGILLEAPLVTVEGGLFANGGAGGGFCSDAPQPGQEALEPATGSQCAGNAAGDGGRGGSALDGPTEGESIPSSSTVEVVAGSGGGAAGYIRINTRSGTFVPAPTALMSPSVDVGTTATR